VIKYFREKKKMQQKGKKFVREGSEEGEKKG
jgi:hypothetical protein